MPDVQELTNRARRAVATGSADEQTKAAVNALATAAVALVAEVNALERGLAAAVERVETLEGEILARDPDPVDLPI